MNEDPRLFLNVPQLRDVGIITHGKVYAKHALHVVARRSMSGFESYLSSDQIY